ncbi:PRP38-assoc multi-domain protein [Pyrenophora tritici-repentis]|nr:PRP38-assoc multi-domain protein [Pyrenophora tritici-repentis]
MNPYHHTDFPANGAGYQPSPPPFSRQRSNSQPPFAPMPEPAYPTYPTANREQVVPYAESSPRRDSTRHRRDTRHRARSVDSHSHHSRSSKDHRRDDDSRMAKMRDRFDSRICERRVWLRRWEEQQRVHLVLDRWRPGLGENPDTQVLLSSLLMPNLEAEAIAAPRPVPAPVRALAHMIASAAKVRSSR